MPIFASLFALVNDFRNGPLKGGGGSVYDFKMKSLAGKEVDLTQFKGRKLLIVNTASNCVYTDQLKELQQLHETAGDKLNILGFPSNDFLWQEPGTNKQIDEFCKINYGVTFPMFEKIQVTGRHAHPLFRWLGGKTGKLPSWNFCKYLVTENGESVKYFNSKVSPLDKQITETIL